MLEDRFELIWSSCKIEKAIAAGAVVFIDFIQAFCQAFVTGLVVELAPMIKNRLSKRLPNFVTDRLPGKLAGGFFKIPLEFVITFVATSESDNRDTGGQLTVGREVIQRGLVPVDQRLDSFFSTDYTDFRRLDNANHQ